MRFLRDPGDLGPESGRTSTRPKSLPDPAICCNPKRSGQKLLKFHRLWLPAKRLEQVSQTLRKTGFGIILHDVPPRSAIQF